MDQSNIKDQLAMDRTVLANERTFLAYFRTFVVFLSSGMAILKLNQFSALTEIGYGLMITGIVLLIMGSIRYFMIRKRLKSYNI